MSFGEIPKVMPFFTNATEGVPSALTPCALTNVTDKKKATKQSKVFFIIIKFLFNNYFGCLTICIFHYVHSTFTRS